MKDDLNLSFSELRALRDLAGQLDSVFLGSALQELIHLREARGYDCNKRLTPDDLKPQTTGQDNETDNQA